MSKQHKTAHRSHSAISDLTFTATAQPLGHRTKYFYDAQDRITNRWSVAKGNTYYTNDALGNLTYVNYPSSTDVKYQYDSLNRLTNMVDAAGTTKYTYTAGNQVWTEAQPFNNSTLTNTYANRLRINLALQQPTGLWTNKFLYDAAGRLTNITSPVGVFSYSVGGPSPGSVLFKRLSFPNTSYVTNTFDSVARLSGTYLKNNVNTTLDSAIYGYDTAGERTSFTNSAGTYMLYSYDKIGQVKVANSSTSTETRGYAYDSAWNVTWVTNTVGRQFTVDTKNEITNWPSGPGTYDGNGNRTAQNSGSGATTLTYDDENRLATFVQSTSHNSALTYDGLGRLRQRIEYTWNGTSWVVGTSTWYIYDGNRVIQERNGVMGDNTPQVSYTLGNDLSGSLEGARGIGGLLARSSGYSLGNWTTNHFYHADASGNISYLEDSSQAMAATYRYDAFGNTLSSSGTLATLNVYRFSSRELHSASGFYIFSYRAYDPSTQRWLSTDPLGDQSWFLAYSRGMPLLAAAWLRSQPQENAYEFVRNNPMAFVDPAGLDCMSDCLNNTLNGAKTFCKAAGAFAVAGLGAIPTTGQFTIGGTAGMNVGAGLGVFAENIGIWGRGTTVAIATAGAINGTVGTQVAAVAAAFLSGAGAGAFLGCAQECFSTANMVNTSPVTSVNNVPPIVISGPITK